jgi:hypothetical protein
LAQSATPPAQHRLLSLFFCAEANRWGPAVRSTFNLQPRVSRAPSWPPAVTGRLPRAPHLKTSFLSRNEAPPSLPLFNQQLPPLNPPLPLIPHQGRGH